MKMGSGLEFMSNCLSRIRSPYTDLEIDAQLYRDIGCRTACKRRLVGAYLWIDWHPVFRSANGSDCPLSNMRGRPVILGTEIAKQG